MEASVLPLANLLELNTRLFLSCLEGIDEDAAQRRPGGNVNHMAFVALHVADARWFLSRQLGCDVPNPFAAFPELEQARGIDDIVEYPPLGTIRGAWEGIGSVLANRLSTVSLEELGAKPTHEFPIGDPTVLGMITFLVGHECHHIGQLGLLRKHLGRGAMSYTNPSP
jgi:uncharacterized damage-inducible protein DinB